MADPITFAGVQIKTSRTGSILLRSLAAALRGPLRGRVRLLQTERFDGMIDGMAAHRVEIDDADRMAEIVAGLAGRHSGGGAYVSSCGRIRLYSYTSGFDLVDAAEDDRRQAAAATLPVIPDAIYRRADGMERDLGAFARMHRATHLEQSSGVEFDERIEKLAALGSDPIAVLAVVCPSLVRDAGWQPVETLADRILALALAAA